MIDITKGTNFKFIGREQASIYVNHSMASCIFLVALFSIQNFHSNLSIFSLIRFGVLDNTKEQNLVSLCVILMNIMNRSVKFITKENCIIKTELIGH